MIDGDTIEIEGGERVRYIGMDTPEDTSVGECFGEQATRRNRELVEGRIVELERDVSETDRFGRLLRYVWVGGEMINEVLVDEGFALAATFPPDVKYESTFLLAQTHARAEGLGLWSACVDAGLAPTGTPPSPGGDCDPSYPDVCIPPPPPDLDCADIIYANFRTIGTDPHGFDGNNDGEACER
ncbi:MAG: thermonuclease family protein [Chloroflexi bacterium]|nr:thermonuclease family protein [Chloroflexota bacterium]